jgi:hypothetical protein
MYKLLVVKPNLEKRNEINLEDVNDSEGNTRDPH